MLRKSSLNVAAATLSALAFLLAVTNVPADPIPGVFNTGVDSNGAVLAGGSVDPNYTSDGTDAFVTLENGYPIGSNWMLNDSTSKWVSPHADENSLDEFGVPVEAAGSYDYRTTFDLTGFDPSTASITGRWATDNLGLDILINGISTGNSITNMVGYEAFTPFVISNGFVSGTNTLDFIVYNVPVAHPTDANPSGLRVEMSGTAAIPEPSTLSLLALGGLLLLRRRKN